MYIDRFRDSTQQSFTNLFLFCIVNADTVERRNAVIQLLTYTINTIFQYKNRQNNC